MHSECLLKLDDDATVHVQLRFLHLLSKEILRVVDGHLEPASSVLVDGELVEPWDEGIERSVEFDVLPSDELEQFFQFSFDGLNESEPLRDMSGAMAAVLIRSQDQIKGTALVSWKLLCEGVMKVSVEVENTTVLPPYAMDRDSVLLSSFLSAHTILSVEGGEFVSLLNPPDDLQQEAKSCVNVGNFPVLVGGEPNMLLCSPILLPGYPRAGHERVGDFHDVTEIDGKLKPHGMTAAAGEKNGMRSGDDRVRRLLPRTEGGAREQSDTGRGTIPSLRSVV